MRFSGNISKCPFSGSSSTNTLCYSKCIMHTSKILLMVTVLLASSALAQTWEVKGQISGWPTGKTAVLKVLPGAPQIATVLKPKALNQTTVDKSGRFVLKIPLRPNFPQMYMEPLTFNKNCQVNTSDKNILVGAVSFLLYDAKGEPLDVLEFKTPGSPSKTLLMFMYARGPVKSSGKCQSDGLSMQIQLNYQEGWNLMVMESRGQDNFLIKTVAASPKGLVWMGMRDLLSLKNSR